MLDVPAIVAAVAQLVPGAPTASVAWAALVQAATPEDAKRLFLDAPLRDAAPRGGAGLGAAGGVARCGGGVLVQVDEWVDVGPGSGQKRCLKLAICALHIALFLSCILTLTRRTTGPFLVKYLLLFFSNQPTGRRRARWAWRCRRCPR